MKRPSLKIYLISGLSAAVLGGGAAAGLHQLHRHPVAADMALRSVQSIVGPVAQVTAPPSPTPSPTPTPTPGVLGKATKAVPAVKPAQRKNTPVICQSQSYDPRKEQACPRAGAPTRQVSLEALADPAANVATLPVIPVPAPTSTPTPSPNATPTPLEATSTPSPEPTSAPIAVPVPLPTATPAPIPGSPACGGGYPLLLCTAAQDSLVDPWGMYNRECVSYAAFRISASGRHMPYWGGSGNARQWPDNARRSGIPVDSSPRVGDIAISTAGPYGHAMYVEEISGERITVSQYNYAAAGEYSTMSVPSAGLSFIHF